MTQQATQKPSVVRAMRVSGERHYSYKLVRVRGPRGVTTVSFEYLSYVRLLRHSKLADSEMRKVVQRGVDAVIAAHSGAVPSGCLSKLVREYVKAQFPPMLASH